MITRSSSRVWSSSSSRGPDFEVLTTCSTASEGLQAVETLKPDVLVLDLKLAGDDGLSVLRRLDSTKPPAGRGAHRQSG